ncbi:outer membrane transport energization protein TonB [Trichlorobacter thiogenes]|uniref:Outer membrane transport energization protein TonB n=1 Tax=Trichlorobacter thiogenes TaxID=115783 RepID=A0A1T4MU60_9BACT|nr:energy transducer TonB [Trichlorobacter thiogenes]SJZ70374.1 outer membrane transport energization protein TonB [Trichlorobacter thiogenes]
MTALPPGRKLRSIRLYLLASLLLHGVLFAAVILLLPTFVQAPPKESTILMTHLGAPPQNTGKELKPQTSPLPASSRTIPIPSALPVPAPPVSAPSSTSMQPVKRSETPPETAAIPALNAKQGKGATVTKQDTGTTLPVQTGVTAGSGRIAPQETTFGGANGPAFRNRVQPVYPSLARRRGKEGVVVLRLSINETGHLTRLEVLEDPGYGFAEAAQEAVRGSSFTPAHHNGKPVAVLATLPIRFNLR